MLVFLPGFPFSFTHLLSPTAKTMRAGPVQGFRFGPGFALSGLSGLTGRRNHHRPGSLSIDVQGDTLANNSKTHHRERILPGLPLVLREVE